MPPILPPICLSRPPKHNWKLCGRATHPLRGVVGVLVLAVQLLDGQDVVLVQLHVGDVALDGKLDGVNFRNCTSPSVMYCF